MMFRLFVLLIWIKAILSVPNVQNVSVAARSETELTLRWSNDNSNYSYKLIDSNGVRQINSDQGAVRTYAVSSLSPGTEYIFTLHTVFEGAQSTGYTFTAITTPLNVREVSTWQSDKHIDLSWGKVSYDSKYDYVLKVGKSEIFIPGYMRHRVSSLSPVTEYNFTLFTVCKDVRSRGYTFTAATVKSLYPGTKYNFTLYCVFDGVRSRGYNFSAETTPSKVTGLHCEHSYLGTVLTVVWDAPFGLWSEFEVQMNAEIPERVTVTRYQIYDVLSVQYDITVTSLSGHTRSTPVSLKCQTNTSGAIAGFVFAVLFIIILFVCLGVFCKHRRFGLRRHSSGEQRNELTTVNNQPIDMIYVNTVTDNTQENQYSSVESECKDVTEENNHYEAPDIMI